MREDESWPQYSTEGEPRQRRGTANRQRYRGTSCPKPSFALIMRDLSSEIPRGLQSNVHDYQGQTTRKEEVLRLRGRWISIAMIDAFYEEKVMTDL